MKKRPTIQRFPVDTVHGVDTSCRCAGRGRGGQDRSRLGRRGCVLRKQDSFKRARSHSEASRRRARATLSFQMEDRTSLTEAWVDGVSIPDRLTQPGAHLELRAANSQTHTCVPSKYVCVCIQHTCVCHTHIKDKAHCNFCVASRPRTNFLSVLRQWRWDCSQVPVCCPTR